MGQSSPLGVGASLELHPWSRGVERPPARRGSPRRLDAAQVARFDEAGFVILEDAIDPDVLREVVAELDPLERDVEADLRASEDERAFIARRGTIHFVYNPSQTSPRLQRFVSGSPFCDLAHDLLGPDVRVFWNQAVYKHGEAPRAFPCHQDNGYGFVEPEVYLTCWLALTDATEENGCPRVFPGLHRRGTFCHRYTPDGFVLSLDAREAVPVPLRAGSVLCFSSLLPHTTGPNFTNSPRKAYILQYAAADAAYLRGDPEAGPPSGREPVADLPASRQWLVLRDGRPVAV